jgi:hypothetical protein
VTVCAHCGRSTWLAECCGSPVVSPTVHVHRESPLRPGAFHLLCRASMREEWHVGEESDQATCPTCIAILDREAAVAA